MATQVAPPGSDAMTLILAAVGQKSLHESAGAFQPLFFKRLGGNLGG